MQYLLETYENDRQIKQIRQKKKKKRKNAVLEFLWSLSDLLELCLISVLM